MTSSRLRRAWWARWLGVVALAVNALVPIHVAFDIADALQAEHGADHQHHSAEWSALALFVGHHEAADHSDEHGDSHHQAACAVCAALGALSGFTDSAPVEVVTPAPAHLPTALAAIAVEPASAPLAYRSRAPPVG